MTSSNISHPLRAALFAVAAALLLTACSNTYGPPVAGQPLTWGQRHYLDVQKAAQDHDSRRSDRSDHAGAGYRP